ncbi:related to peptide-n4-(n-acetyl-beta-d-glucosaminyl) asparaginase amidase N [Serendipita indica DSM 11827]|uniref:Related to peptide-n4-(N-acetyl-beta-d-glucosaminyl) asparaginase amidase N n=1 Tax=Serendipita indica (strain DSM 11827) TaxID=1109443 RepID=G4U3C3_SERID|nr:related to peptide-n4-(n-acetyl-beta-d-glucosaminyl) asparaginase amidase N [Serendipita indica DSM 11827]
MALLPFPTACFLTILVSVFTASIAQQNISTPLINFQVSQPLNLPKNVRKCEVELIHHIFANSYYQPSIVQYTQVVFFKVGTWAGVSLNWTATSNGTQYDRLAGVTLHNVEIWRTSTSEPTPRGIIWTTLKDVTKYIPLFAKPGKMIVDLNNIIDPGSGLTGEFDVRLTATFYQSDWVHPAATVPDLIIPLSTLVSDQSNVFSVPPAGNTTIILPPNTVSAVVEIQASGNSQEEFWYYNVPDEYMSYLPPDTTYGKSSFREVRVLVDGVIAGIAFPYPVLFTGAMVPTIWRPIVAYGAYDSPTYTVDISPFIPLLADGRPHIISLAVVSDEPDLKINSNWYLSGNIKVALDTSGKPTTGNITRYDAPSEDSRHSVQVLNDSSFNFTVSVRRSLSIEARLVSGSGKKIDVSWKQNLQFNNVQSYLNGASTMLVSQTTTGHSLSTHNLIPVLVDSLDFPLSIDFRTVADEKGSGFRAIFDHKYNRQYLPSHWEVFTNIRSAQHANGTYITSPNPGFNRTANGTNINEFSYLDAKLNSYSRSVEVTNNTITRDKEGGSLTWNFWPLVGEPWTSTSLLGGLLQQDAAHLPARAPARHMGPFNTP